MKLKNLLILLGVLAVLLVLKFLFFPAGAADTSKFGAKKGLATNVSAYVVKPMVLDNTIAATGTIIANEEVELHPEVPGKLIVVYFKEGTSVKAGELLAKLNDADLQAQLRKQQLLLKLSKEREQRLQGLLAIGGVSQEEFDAVANQSQTIAADIDYTKAQIAKTEIRAPFSGKIGLKLMSTGAYVSSSSTIATIQQTNVLKIDFTVPEIYAQLLKTGSEVQFKVAEQGQTRTAKVYAIEPKIDVQTRNISVRALYDNALSDLFPGSFVQIQLSAAQDTNALMIPTEAVVPELKGKKVFVAQNGKALPIKVKTGTRNDKMIQIVDGLKIGDTVIVTGIMSLKPEAPIQIISIK